ncbi:hypothetical protein FRC07_000783, partial [Ceratobasidium sp. 392]
AVLWDWASFPFLRIIEIQCPETKSDIPELVKVAKEALQSCAGYAPATKPTKVQTKQDGTDAYNDMYKPKNIDPRVVKVCYMPGRYRPLGVVCKPFKIGVFPV